jgi:hypothetical protein
MILLKNQHTLNIFLKLKKNTQTHNKVHENVLVSPNILEVLRKNISSMGVFEILYLYG